MQVSQVLERPRFRQDLVAELITEQGTRFIDVMCPNSGNAFRFFEVEYSVACAMDGERDVAAIVRWAQEELGLAPTPREVMTVIATLGDLGFVVSGRDDMVSDELAAGVVVGDHDTRVDVGPPAHVELGRPGAAPPGMAAQPPSPAPKAADVALGAPGAGAKPATPKQPVEDIGLGAPGVRPPAPPRAPAQARGAATPGKDLSVDLADHIAVRPDDVKEAVRQSRVVSAVDVPRELMDTIDPVIEPPTAVRSPAPMPPMARSERSVKPAHHPQAEPAPAPRPAPEPAPVAARHAEPAEPAEPARHTERTEPAAAKPERAPIEVPRQPRPQPVAAEETAEPPRAGLSPVLVVALIAVVVAAAAFLVWRFALGASEEEQGTGAGSEMSGATPGAMPAGPGATPMTMVSTVAVESLPPQDVMAPAGELASIEPEGTAVKTGDVVATMGGRQPIDTEIERLTKEATTLADELKNAETAKDEAKIAGAKKKVEANTTAMTAKKAELEKLQIKSPADGKLTGVAKPGTKLTADTAIAKIERPSGPMVKYNMPVGVKLPADGKVTLTIGPTGQQVVCTIADAQHDSIKVACPSDAGLQPGAEARFTPSP